MKFTYVIRMCKSVFNLKDDINSIIILYTNSHKWFQIEYGLCLEIAACIFSVKLDVLLLFHWILVHFIMHIQFKDRIQGCPKIIEYIASYFQENAGGCFVTISNKIIKF